MPQTLDDLFADHRMRGAYLDGCFRGTVRALIWALEADTTRSLAIRTAEARVKAALADIITHEAKEA
jgi:hypothetical protein